jgi:hypothetical protein
LRDGLAGFQADHPRGLVGAPDHLVGDPVQRIGTLEGGGRGPGRQSRLRRDKRRSVSASAACGQSPSDTSVTGLKTGAVAPARAARHSPAMNRPKRAYIRQSP